MGPIRKGQTEKSHLLSDASIINSFTGQFSDLSMNWIGWCLEMSIATGHRSLTPVQWRMYELVWTGNQRLILTLTSCFYLMHISYLFAKLHCFDINLIVAVSRGIGLNYTLQIQFSIMQNPDVFSYWPMSDLHTHRNWRGLCLNGNNFSVITFRYSNVEDVLIYLIWIILFNISSIQANLCQFENAKMPSYEWYWNAPSARNKPGDKQWQRCIYILSLVISLTHNSWKHKAISIESEIL